MRPRPWVRCSGINAAQVCAERWDAIRVGTFAFSLAAGGWLWRDAQDADVPLFECPFCGGNLPTADLVYHRPPVKGRR